MTTNVALTNKDWTQVLTGTSTSTRVNVYGKVEWFSSPSKPASELRGHAFDPKGDLFDKGLAAGVTVWMKAVQESTTATVVTTTSLELFGS